MSEVKPQFKYRNIVDVKNKVGTMLREQGLEIFGKGGNVQIGSHKHFYFLEPKTGRKHWIKFTNENFHTFGSQFREYRGTVGETINKAILDMLKDTDILYFGYPMYIYTISVGEFRENLRNRVNDSEGIETVSIPICMLKRLDLD